MLYTFVFFQMNCIEERKSCLRSDEMPEVILLVSITIPKKVSWVDGPSVFEVLIKALVFSHSKSMAWKLFERSTEPGEPAVKKPSR